jgi:hypothetical protein
LDQNGFDDHQDNDGAVAIAGTSFSMRKVRPLKVRWPRASFLDSRP